MQVLVYVDGILVGEGTADRETPHHIVHRLCELDAVLQSATQQAAQQIGVGFRVPLPALTPGSHQVRPCGLCRRRRRRCHGAALVRCVCHT